MKLQISNPRAAPSEKYWGTEFDTWSKSQHAKSFFVSVHFNALVIISVYMNLKCFNF